MRKKLISAAIILIILLMFIIPFSSYSANPYAGRYYMNGNNNISIILKDNQTFTLINTFGKDYLSFDGSYSINNNIIYFKFNDGNVGKLYDYISTGKVEGSVILLKASHNNLFLRKQTS